MSEGGAGMDLRAAAEAASVRPVRSPALLEQTALVVWSAKKCGSRECPVAGTQLPCVAAHRGTGVGGHALWGGRVPEAFGGLSTPCTPGACLLQPEAAGLNVTALILTVLGKQVPEWAPATCWPSAPQPVLSRWVLGPWPPPAPASGGTRGLWPR